MHGSGSQCLIPQGVVPSWLPPGAILFPLAARNSQQVYQDGVKYQCSCSSYLKTFNPIAEYTHKNLSSTGWWITAAFLGMKRLWDIGFRKEGRQTKGTPTSLTPEIANIHVPGSSPMLPLTLLRNWSVIFCYKHTRITRVIDILSRLINSCLINYSIEPNS